MNTPKELKYSKTHEWLKEEADGTVTVGITDYAQDKLGSLVFINLPSEGDEVTEDESFCDVESVKADSDVMSPVSGIAKIKPSAPAEGLMDADEYEEFCSKEDE